MAVAGDVTGRTEDLDAGHARHGRHKSGGVKELAAMEAAANG